MSYMCFCGTETLHGDPPAPRPDIHGFMHYRTMECETPATILATLADLRAQRTDLQARNTDLVEDGRRLGRQFETLRARVLAAIPFMTHHDSCPFDVRGSSPDTDVCTCGVDKAVERLREVL